MKILIMFLMLISMNVNASFCTSLTGAHGTVDGRPVSQYFTDGLPSMQECNEYVILTAVEYTVINEKAKIVDSAEEITVASVSAAFSFGASTYSIFWFIGFKGRLAKQAIRAA
mgnify:CR=1 FL=1